MVELRASTTEFGEVNARPLCENLAGGLFELTRKGEHGGSFVGTDRSTDCKKYYNGSEPEPCCQALSPTLRLRRAAKRQSLADPIGAGQILSRKHSVGFQNQLDRLAQVLASLFQGLALGIRAGEFFHEGDVAAFGCLEADSGQL